MKYFPIIIYLSLNGLSSFWSQPEQHKAISYNIRYDGHSDLAPDWKERKVPIVAQINKQTPTIIGFQEVLQN
ncbi:MAG: hypothetical protein ACK46P_04940, partial [Flavobacteriia bacterium]